MIVHERTVLHVVGAAVADGLLVGRIVVTAGDFDGEAEGVAVGVDVGLTVGDIDGLLVGDREGIAVGRSEGDLEGEVAVSGVGGS